MSQLFTIYYLLVQQNPDKTIKINYYLRFIVIYLSSKNWNGEFNERVST